MHNTHAHEPTHPPTHPTTHPPKQAAQPSSSLAIEQPSHRVAQPSSSLASGRRRARCRHRHRTRKSIIVSAMLWVLVYGGGATPAAFASSSSWGTTKSHSRNSVSATGLQRARARACDSAIYQVTASPGRASGTPDNDHKPSQYDPPTVTRSGGRTSGSGYTRTTAAAANVPPPPPCQTHTKLHIIQPTQTLLQRMVQ
jgi:hypothetical protein